MHSDLSEDEICQVMMAGSHAIVRTREGVIVAWTEGASRIYGWSRQEAIGRITHELFGTEFPVPIEEVNAELDRSGSWIGELIHKTKSGEKIVVQSLWKQAVGASNRPYVVETNNKITELATTRNRLEDSERRLQLAQEVAHVGVWDWNASTGTTICSDEWFWQYGRSPQQYGPPHEEWLSWIHPDDRDLVVRALEKATTTGSPYVAEYRVIDAEGRVHWLYARAQAVMNAEGQCIRLIGANIDVTERHGYEERLHQINRSLAQSNEDLKQFSYTVGHDLKEPLRTVSSCSTLLKLRLGDAIDPEVENLSTYIEDASRRMRAMLEGLLEYARASEQDLPKETVHAELLVRGALHNLASALSDTQAEVSIGLLPTVDVNPAAVTQVFQNLIGNALKFRRTAVPVRVEIRALGYSDEWIFSVADNGVGIDPRYSEKIFQIFTRLNRAHAPGTGVGLPISRRMIERHGGRMWVESEENQGATFRFSIPKRSFA